MLRNASLSHVEIGVVSICHYGDLERVVKINDPGDDRMTFVDYIELIVLKSAKMLKFLKQFSREFNDPYTFFCGSTFLTINYQILAIKFSTFVFYVFQLQNSKNIVPLYNFDSVSIKSFLLIKI
jgi:hypothetical protein